MEGESLELEYFYTMERFAKRDGDNGPSAVLLSDVVNLRGSEWKSGWADTEEWMEAELKPAAMAKLRQHLADDCVMTRLDARSGGIAAAAGRSPNWWPRQMPRGTLLYVCGYRRLAVPPSGNRVWLRK
jgi:hypothetical protein